MTDARWARAERLHTGSLGPGTVLTDFGYIECLDVEVSRSGNVTVVDVEHSNARVTFVVSKSAVTVKMLTTGTSAPRTAFYRVINGQLIATPGISDWDNSSLFPVGDFGMPLVQKMDENC